MGNPYTGEIRLFGGNFAPRGWRFCDGSLLPITGNETLFQLIGTTYGGDGQSTFMLPDLRGRVPIHTGQGFVWGQLAGTETVTLTTNQMPSHTHTGSAGTLAVAAVSTAGNRRGPGAAIPAKEATGVTDVYSSAPPDTTMAPGTITGVPTIAASGGGQPVGVMQPSLAISFIICLTGIFPARN
jgi:microcystin-dependent protein